MSFNFSVNAGESYSDTLKIVNPVDSEGEVHYKVSVVPYSVTDDKYTADLSSETQRTQIAKWVNVEITEGTIQPNETVEIPFTVDVPEGTPAGGQYAAIVVSSIPKETETSGVNFNNIYEMAALLYANVNGKTERGGSILENSIPIFSTKPTVNVNAMVENTGNTHEQATVSLIVTDFFKGEEIFSTKEEGNSDFSEVIMPETKRFLTREIKNLPSLGIIKIEQTIKFNGDVSKEDGVVVIAPIWFIVLVLLTLSAIIAGIVFRVKAKLKQRSMKL